MKKVHIFFDMDGTIVKYNKDLDGAVSTKTAWNKKGEHYFAGLPPIEPMVKLVKQLIHNYKTDSSVQIHIISQLNQDVSLYTENRADKLEWLYNNGIDVTFHPVVNYKDSGRKAEYIKRLIDKERLPCEYILIDDLPQNCLKWYEAGGTSIHFMNKDTRHKYAGFSEYNKYMFQYRPDGENYTNELFGFIIGLVHDLQKEI